MRSGRVVTLAMVAFIAMSAVPAFAACALGCGGGFDAFSYRTEYLWPGQTVTWNTQAYTDKNAKGPNDGPFFAYLVEPRGSAGRVPYVEGGTPLAIVETGEPGRFSTFDVSVTFTVPATTSLGSHVVEVCDDPCTKRLGYLGPTRVEVVSGDVEARLHEQIDELSQKVRGLQGSTRSHARRAAKRSSNVLRAEAAVLEEKLDLRISEVALRVTELERQIASQRASDEPEDVSQSALAGGVVVLLLCGWLLRERTRNRDRGAPAQAAE